MGKNEFETSKQSPRLKKAHLPTVVCAMRPTDDDTQTSDKQANIRRSAAVGHRQKQALPISRLASRRELHAQHNYKIPCRPVYAYGTYRVWMAGRESDRWAPERRGKGTRTSHFSQPPSHGCSPKKTFLLAFIIKTAHSGIHTYRAEGGLFPLPDVDDVSVGNFSLFQFRYGERSDVHDFFPLLLFLLLLLRSMPPPFGEEEGGEGRIRFLLFF